jgi:RNA polymerase sigma-70 factor, ECF subfamily
MDELQIIKACQNGDLSHFTQLYDSYHQAIYRFIYYRVHHKETAEDLTSTVFIKALENINQFKPSKGAFSSWIYRIARNSVIDHVRAHKGTDDITAAFDLSDNTNIPRDFDTQQQLQKVWRYLKDLDSKQRDIVIMRVWDGLSHKEIAETLSMTEASVKMAFSRTMSKLNQELVYAMAIALIILNSSF